jgi:hypothetical protein
LICERCETTFHDERALQQHKNFCRGSSNSTKTLKGEI